MKVSKILKKVKRIDEDLYRSLKRALTHPYDSYYRHEYAQFTSLSHAIHSGFKWKNTEEGHEFWEDIVNGIDSAKDGSNLTFDLLSFISEQHRKKRSPLVVDNCQTPRMLINEAISANNAVGARIQIEFMRYSPGLIDVRHRHISMYTIISSINWANTKEGFAWWEKLRNTIVDDNCNLIPEKLKDYDSATK